MDHLSFMQQAIAQAREGIAAGQSPFGAVIVQGDQIIGAAHNTVWRDCDPTAHAEVNAIRQAARVLGTIRLTGCVIYSTCEPCPMCLTAIHWAKIEVVCYGATIADAQRAGFCELCIPARQMATLGGSFLRVEEHPLRGECAQLFEEWQRAGLSTAY